MSKKIDRKSLAAVMAEINELGFKDSCTKAELRQLATLQATAAALREGGITLDEIRRKDFNEYSREAGLPEAEQAPEPSKRELRHAAWQAVVKNATKSGHAEVRDMNVGNPISQIGTYTGLGFFVPTGFFNKVWDAMAAHDALFDDEHVFVVRTPNAHPFPVPVADDTSHIATVLAEGNQYTEEDIADVDHVTIGAWRYGSPFLRV